MARYQLINPRLRTIGQRYNPITGAPEGGIDQTKQNAGQKYLYAEMINKDCPWEEAAVFTSFRKATVEIVEPLLSIARGGTAQQDQPLPDYMQTITGCYVAWVAPQPFYKKHLSAHPANPRTGEPAVNPGDLVTRGGKPVLFTTLTVFCQYYIDELGQKQWMRGASPDEAGQAAFNNYCIPATTDPTPQTVGQQETIGGQTITTVNPQTVGQQPIQQPTFINNGAQPPTL